MEMKQGYVNGSDLLMSIDGKAAAHCTSHTTSYNSETKDRAVKPSSSASASAGLWKEKSVTGLSVQVKVEGLRFYSDKECGLGDMLSKWKVGAPVALKGFARSADAAPYMSGNFIVTSLEENAPAGDDTTYSATFDNTGEVTIDETKIDGAEAEEDQEVVQGSDVSEGQGVS